jgi:hypothetical protein
MPEEYRVWKEKMDAVERKLEEKKRSAAGGPPSATPGQLSSLAGNVVGLQTPSVNVSTNNSTTVNNSGASNSIPTVSNTHVTANNAGNSNNTNTHVNGKKSNPSQNLPTYATPAEAMEAFKDLLAQKHVSTTAKMKEVQDLCQSDPRWEALQTMGEKRQALAEYQTKKLKMEKEQQKQKQRKHKDSFLLMLAENTNIDIKTRWKDAIEMLKDDNRYKNIEDHYEREELFNDFIKELEKKEREDRVKRKEHALSVVRDHMKAMAKDGKITLRTNWSDIRENILTLISRSDLRILEESDCRRLFQDLSREMMEEYKRDEQKRKEDYQKSIQTKVNEFKLLLLDCVKDGEVIAFTRWKEIMELSRVITSTVYQELYALMVTNNPSVTSQPQPQQPSSSSSSSSAAVNPKEMEKLQGEFEFLLRGQFDEVITKVQETYKADKKLIKRFLHEINYEVAHDTKYEDWKTMMLRFLNMKEEKHATIPGKVVYVHAPVGSISAAKKKKNAIVEAEEGEELEDGEDIEEGEERPVKKSNSSNVATSSSSAAAVSSSSNATFDGNTTTGGTSSASTGSITEQLQEMLLQRPYNLKEIFQDLHDKAYDEWEEEQRLKKKNEEKFLNLLKEYFYLSDHVNISWDDAKAIISNRSAYDLLHKSDKKRIFYDYMAQLKEKMEQKALAMRALSEGVRQELEPGECPPSSSSSYQKVSSCRWYTILVCDCF